MSIVLRARAKRDLFEIWRYIAQDNPEKADAVLDKINKNIDLLTQMPQLGRLRPELKEALRSFSVGIYIIFYFERPDGIEIVRLLHGSLDIAGIFIFEEDLDESLCKGNA